jgi:molecular chaperone GrpE
MSATNRQPSEDTTASPRQTNDVSGDVPAEAQTASAAGPSEDTISVVPEAGMAGGAGQPAAEPLPTPEEIQELRKKAAERDTLFSDYQRARADYLNLQRRTQRDRSEWQAQAVKNLVSALLPVMDQLEMAVSWAGNSTEPGTLAQGVSLVRDSFLAALKKCRIEPICAQNQPFDPKLHEAVTQEENPGLPDMTVVQELRRGYALDGKVLRPAQVKVSRNYEDMASAQEAQKAEV